MLGAVLAGGQSGRFGSDKALALIEGMPLLDHAINSLECHTATVVVAGRAWHRALWLADRPIHGMGPLSGLNAALHHAFATGHDWVLSVACDTPFLPPGLLHQLAAFSAPAYVEGHPVIGLWPSDAAPVLDKFLERPGKHSVRGFAAAIDSAPWNPGVDIANFNYMADLENWRMRVGTYET